MKLLRSDIFVFANNLLVKGRGWGSKAFFTLSDITNKKKRETKKSNICDPILGQSPINSLK